LAGKSLLEKRQIEETAAGRLRRYGCLSFAFGLAQAGNAVAGFPLTAFLEQFQALKALEHVSFTAQGGGGAQTPML